MNFKTLGLCLLGVCGAGATLALAQATPARAPVAGGAAHEPAAAPAASISTSAASTSAADTAPALSREEAQKIIGASRPYLAHPQPATTEAKTSKDGQIPDGKITKSPAKAFDMAEAPPAPRAEAKPAAPSPGLVWVEGHYIPVDGKWRWVHGEWAVPATPISVWIPARYLPEDKKWEPGYWQPDSVPTVPPEHEATKDGTPASPAPKAGSDYLPKALP